MVVSMGPLGSTRAHSKGINPFHAVEDAEGGLDARAHGRGPPVRFMCRCVVGSVYPEDDFFGVRGVGCKVLSQQVQGV
jgi:hypothetical protein